MSSPDRDRPQRGGPGARRAREWQGWNGQGWNGPGWYDESGDRRRGWVGDWREASWDEPEDSGRVQDRGSSWRRSDVPGKRVRIGDAERDQAVSLLSEHFVAGRLTQAEFEERSEQATRARYADDLEPLFDELPTSMELQLVPRGPAGLRRRPGPPPPFMMLAPFLMVGLVISSIALTAPWLLWGVFWIVLLSGMSRNRWHHYRR